MNTSIITIEYNGQPFLFREDGYFNANTAAKKFGKDARDFLYSIATKEYVEALETAANHRNIIQAKKGRNGGTWLHPKLAVFFARWLDVRFAVVCDMTIENILKGSLSVSVAVPTEEALMLKDSLDAAKARILQLEGEVKELQEKGLKDGAGRGVCVAA